MIATEQILSQLKALIGRYRALRARDQAESRYLPGRQRTALLTSAQAAIERFAPPASPYVTNCRGVLESDSGAEYQLECLMGIVEALRHDYESGALAPIQDLIRAEVFDDFLEMAEHLLEMGYKDPAAVLTGGVLEQQLRKLCSRADISAEHDAKHKKADTLNAELAGKGIYGKLDQKSVTSWLDLRNKAAHADYAAYATEQVRLMVLGVRDFLRRTSA